MAVRKDLIQLSIEINGVKAGKTYDELKRNARDLNRELSKLTPGTDAFVKKAEELKKVNNVLATIRRESAGVAQGTGTLTNLFKQGAVAAVGFFSIQKVTQWGREFVSWFTRGAVALEDMRDKSLRTFGDSIDIVQDFAAINAQQLGITEEKYASLAAQIGAILVPMGLSREEAAKMSSEALNLSAALSEWSNGQLTVEQTQEILTKGLQGQTKVLKQLGITLDESDIKARLAAKGQDELTGSALKAAKAQAVLELVTERTKDAQAEFAASGEDAGRAVARIGAYFDQLKENVLSAFLPAWKTMTNAIANTLSPLKRQSDLVGDLQAQFNIQIETLRRGNLSQENRKKLIEEINTKYREYLPNLLTEKTTMVELYEVQKKANEVFKQRILLLSTQELLLDAQKKQIENEREAKNLQEELTAQTIKFNEALEKYGAKRGGKRGSTEFIKDELYYQALQRQSVINEATLLAEIERRVKVNQEAAQGIAKDFEEISGAAQNLGLNLDAILNPPSLSGGDGSGGGGAEDKIKEALKRIEDQVNLERQLRLQAAEAIRSDTVAYTALREQINIESDKKIAEQQAQLYKSGTLDNLKLLQEAIDAEARLRANAAQLSLDQQVKQIDREKELQISALREVLDDREILDRQIEIVELQSARRIAEAKLKTLREGTPEYLATINEIASLEQQIHDKVQSDALSLTESGLQQRRLLALQALDQMGLDEEDYQKARERIELETDIDILKAKITLYAANTEQRLQLERELADKVKELQGNTFSIPAGVAGAGGFSTPADGDKQLSKEQQRRQQALQAGISVATTLANSIASIERNRIDTTLQRELDAIERIAEAKRKAAGDDDLALRKIEAEARLAREKAEKKAAEERKKVAKREAIIQGALAVIEALPNAFAAIAAGIATAAQIAIIDKQTFYKGGYTGRGLYRDQTGHRVAGVVHDGEWVAPRSMVEDPVIGPQISYLESVRRARRGYAEGGLATVSTRPQAYVQTVTGAASSPELQEIRTILADIRTITATWPTVIKAVLAYTDLENMKETVDGIRGKSRS